MTQASIAADVHHPLDVHLNLLAQVSFDHSLLVYDAAYPGYFFFSKVSNALIDADMSLLQYFVGTGSPDPVNIGQAYLDSLIRGKINTRYACHSRPSSAQPCRCLCLGLEQITLTTPRR
jgi:hypothetical protein